MESDAALDANQQPALSILTDEVTGSRDRAVSEASEDVEVDDVPAIPTLKEAKPHDVALGVRVSVVTAGAESAPEKAGSDISAPSGRSQPRRFGKGSMGKRPLPLKKR